MAEKPRALFRRIADVLRLEDKIARPDGRAADTWHRWFWDFVFGVNENFQSAGVDDTSTSDAGRLAALEEEIKALRGHLPAREGVQFPAFDAAPFARHLPPDIDPLPVYVAPVADQNVDPPRLEQLAARVAVLETIGTAPTIPALAEQQIVQIAEAAVADAITRAPAFDPVLADLFDAAPLPELGQLFKARIFTQWVGPLDMYVPVTQPAAGPNMYETVVGGSAFQCWECAPGTLATDNDNVMFLISPPDGWDGNPVVVRVAWTHSATVTNFLVAWSCVAQQYIDQGSGVAAFGAEAVVQDVGGVTNAFYSTVPLVTTPANVLPATAVSQYPVLFKVKRRNQSEGAVGLAVNARIVGIQVFWGLRPVALT